MSEKSGNNPSSKSSKNDEENSKNEDNMKQLHFNKLSKKELNNMLSDAPGSPRKESPAKGNDLKADNSQFIKEESHGHTESGSNLSSNKNTNGGENEKMLEKEDFLDEEEEDEQNDYENELMEAFNEFDEDHSGSITKEDLGNFMRKLGYRPTLVELQEMMEEVGKDHQGQITFEDFKHIMTKTIYDDYTINATIEAFAVFDKNKTGKLKKENLQNILLTKGEQNMSESEVQDLLDHYVDFDENGEIAYKDYVKQTFELFK